MNILNAGAAIRAIVDKAYNDRIEALRHATECESTWHWRPSGSCPDSERIVQEFPRMTEEEIEAHARQHAELVYQLELRKTRRNAEIAKEVQAITKDVLKGAEQVFLTVRPDTTKIDLRNFMMKMFDFLNKPWVTDYTLSFEQKGTSADTLGQGFHAHVFITTDKYASTVGQLAQQCFKASTAPNCIDYAKAFDGEQGVQKYLVDYDSKDGHKAETKEWDAQWRAQENIRPLYHKGPGHMPIKSNRHVVISW